MPEAEAGVVVGAAGGVHEGERVVVRVAGLVRREGRLRAQAGAARAAHVLEGLEALFHALLSRGYSSVSCSLTAPSKFAGVGGLTLASTVCHFSLTRCATSFHISSRTSKYARARSSTRGPSQLSALRRSIRRSWRLRHALGVLPAKCCAMGAQFMPLARSWVKRLSSSFVHAVDARSEPGEMVFSAFGVGATMGRGPVGLAMVAFMADLWLG